MAKKTSIPERLRRQVQERAQGCCEYCLIHEADMYYPEWAILLVRASDWPADGRSDGTPADVSRGVRCMVGDLSRSEQTRTHLIASLRDQSFICSDQVAQAFLTVPREIFVPFFYEQERFSWIKRTPDLYEQNAWLDAVYRDEPLVTLVDQRKFALSSSSAPSVMAMMLEALDVQPGMSVLEIGTGTGYNAALLAHLVGDPTLVTTMDIEESLARRAEEVLHAHSGPVFVQVGDGCVGVPDRAPFDRIVATASSPGIPRAWYDQLAPGGRLVMDLQGSLRKSGFLIVQKQTDGRASGSFDTRYLYFMPMRHHTPPLICSPVELLRLPATREITVDDGTALTLFENRSFLWFLQWSAPGISLAKAKVTQGNRAGQMFVTWIDSTKKTIIQLYFQDKQWSGQQRGSTGLWDTVEQAYDEWTRLGCPGQDAYCVAWDHQQFRLFLQGSALSFSLENSSLNQ